MLERSPIEPNYQCNLRVQAKTCATATTRPASRFHTPRMGLQQLGCRRSRDLLVGVVMVVNRRGNGVDMDWNRGEQQAKADASRQHRELRRGPQNTMTQNIIFLVLHGGQPEGKHWTKVINIVRPYQSHDLYHPHSPPQPSLPSHKPPSPSSYANPK